MLSKLNLDGTKRFEIAIACNRTAQMIAAFIEGREGAKGIGSEQGGIPKWDDLVVDEPDGTLTHIQVKRNNTDFSDKPVIRSVKPKVGGLMDLSPLDESVTELSTWISKVNLATIHPNRKFIVEVPDGEVQIKRGLTVNHLRELCETITDATSQIRFADLLANSQSAFDAATWMKSWCGFANDNDVLAALKLLSVCRSGSENQLEGRTKEILASYFTDIDNVYLILYGLTLRTSTFVSCLTPKAVLLQISRFLLPTVGDWTHYALVGSSYEKRGTHDKRDGSIEHPSVVVPHLWNAGKRGLLRLTAQPNISQKLPRAIVRLALHLQAGSVAQLSDNNAWNIQAKQAVGGTLGLEENDLDALPTIACTGAVSRSEFMSLATLVEHEQEADLLSNEMQREVWTKVHQDVNRLISELPNTELRTAIERRFGIWNTALSADIVAQHNLCTSMLHPAAEGAEIVIEFRVGPKTVRLISRGIFYLLIVSVAMTANDNSWQDLDDALSVHVKANRYWSGPAGMVRKPRRFSDAGRDKFLAAEPSKVLVLSETELSPSEVREFILIDDEPADHLATAREPQIIVTACMKLRSLIEAGNIANIKAYLNGLSIKKETP